MPKEFVDRLLKADQLVLTTHVRPDGDAVGSQLALALYLRARGKRVRAFNSDAPPHNMDWLPGIDMLEVFDSSIDQREYIDSADLAIVLDTNSENRLGGPGPAIRARQRPTLLIDHHTDPETWFDGMYRRETASSTGQLVFELISADDPSVIDRDIASALYVAVMTDTGSFRFSNVNPTVHRMVAELLERGELNPAELHSEVYDKRSLPGIRLFARVLQTLEIVHDGQLATLLVERQTLKDTGAPVEETDGLANWGLSIEGVRVSTIFTETERGTKISFRSKGDDHVHRWAQSLGGGGHVNASGAFVKLPLADAIDLVKTQASRYLGDVSDDSENGMLPMEDAEYLSALLSKKFRVTRS